MSEQITHRTGIPGADLRLIGAAIACTVPRSFDTQTVWHVWLVHSTGTLQRRSIMDRRETWLHLTGPDFARIKEIREP